MSEKKCPTINNNTCFGHTLLNEIRNAVEFHSVMTDEVRGKFDELDKFIDDLERSENTLSIQCESYQNSAEECKILDTYKCFRNCPFRKKEHIF